MANEEQLAILKQGVRGWNEWRAKNPEIKPDLREANLFHGNLAGANLVWADLSKANVSWVNLSMADFTGALLWEATLKSSNLIGVSFKLTDLNGTDFSKAILGPVISASKFSEHLSVTSFDDVDLSVAVGLETVQHNGSSTIGIDTIYRSNGKIPEVFLRGCGVPEDMIDFVRRLREKR